MPGDGSSSFAVEPTPGAAAPAELLPRRRHRWLTAPSGVVIFICLFLPAVRICGSPTYPYEAFGVQTPYVLGLLAAVVAVVRRPRALAGVVLAMRILIWVTAVGWAIALVVIGIDEGEVVPILVWVPVSAVLVWIFGRGPRDERAAVRATLGSAIACAVWFGLFVFDPGAMYGTYTGAVGSIGLLGGGLAWWRESRPPEVVRRTTA